MDDLSRLEQILELRAERLTYAEIGARLGISKQRVWQIANAGKRQQEIREIAERLEDVRGQA